MSTSPTGESIYGIRHVVSGRIYVGSAVNVRLRWSVHRYALRKGTHPNRMLQYSWNKHGEATFVFCVLERVSDPSRLCEREDFWIQSFRATERAHGFNIRPKATNNLGLRHSTETRAKMSAAHAGKKYGPHSSGRIAAMSAALKGRAAPNRDTRMSEEQRAKLRALRLGKLIGPMTDEHKKKISTSCIGRIPWNKKDDVHGFCAQCANRFVIHRNRPDQACCSRACANKLRGRAQAIAFAAASGERQ